MIGFKDITLPKILQFGSKTLSGKKGNKWKQWMAAIIATTALYMMGMFLGWSSPVIKKLQAPDAELRLTDEQISWMVSLLYIGSMTSPLPTGLIIDRFGRKAGLYLTALEALSAWLLLLTTNTAMGIYAARFLGGMVGGSAYTVAPIYLCEIAEPDVRGALNSIFILMAYIGIMFEYGIGPNVTYAQLNFLSSLVPFIIIVLLTFIPESPYFYTMRENKEAAAKSLMWLRCAESPADIENELVVIQKAVSEDMKNKKGILDLFRTKGNRRGFMLTEVLAVLQRMSGISVIMAYAASAAPSSWFLTDDQCAIFICVTWIAFGLMTTGLVDRLGRKCLTVVSCAGCGVAMATYGLCDYLMANSLFNLENTQWFSFAALIVYSAFFPIGLGCVPNMIQGEVFPANIKGVASGITSIIIAFISFITNKIYQPIGVAFGLYVNYCIYTAFCIFGIYFAIFVLIETKGKTLQEIQINLSNGKE